MEIIKKVGLPPEVSLYIERLEYEYAGWKNLLLIAERIKSDDDTYSRIARDANEKFLELEFAKDEVRTTYIPEEYRFPCYQFYVDFSTYEVVVFRGDAK